MKKLFLMILAALLVLSCFGCNKTGNTETTTEATTTEATTTAKTENVEDINKKSEGTMTYAEYAAAAIDDAVVIEAYVQAKQGWWQDKATIYTQDADGAYFIYELPCTEEEYNQMTIGTKLKVSGYKAEWAGEIEIVDATWEILEGSYIAPAKDVTALLGTEDLIKNQNMFVSFKGMTVAASKNAEGNDVPYLFKWDGSGQDGDDLYFNVSIDGETYTFTVESYLCGKGTDVYEAVKNFKIGDVIDMEGFLYWYEGVNPHITAVKAAN